MLDAVQIDILCVTSDMADDVINDARDWRAKGPNRVAKLKSL